MTERAMAKVVKLDDVIKHENSDNLELAIVGGWQVIIKKGEFKAGDWAVYCEVDSFLPEGNPAWDFLMARGTKEMNGVRGHVLKSIKLRKELSQGLVLPLYLVDHSALIEKCPIDNEDVSELLGISKYEPPVNPNMNAQAKGTFPSWIQKTDEERIQNLKLQVENDWAHMEFYLHEKLDGSSFTAYVRDGVFGVCSRNQELKVDDHNPWCDMARSLNLQELMLHYCEFRKIDNLVIQGELIGHGMNGNKYLMPDRKLFLFTAQHNGKRVHHQALEQTALCLGIPMVPLLHISRYMSVKDHLEAANALRSTINPEVLAEGYVARSVTDSCISFKVISNEWLLKYKE